MAQFSNNSSFDFIDGVSACYKSYDTVVLHPISIALAIKVGSLGIAAMTEVGAACDGTDPASSTGPVRARTGLSI